MVDGCLYVQTDLDAPTRRIVAVPLATPGRKHWVTVIPEGDVPIEASSLVAGRIGLLALRDVASDAAPDQATTSLRSALPDRSIQG